MRENQTGKRKRRSSPGLLAEAPRIKSGRPGDGIASTQLAPKRRHRSKMPVSEGAPNVGAPVGGVFW